MSTRRAKQIVYGALYAIIWIGVIFLAYSWFIKPAPSCFDGVKDQNETGVDCGGVCTLACGAKAAQAIAPTGPVAMFMTSGGNITLLVQIQNPNTNLASENFNYTFDLYSPAGTVVGQIPGQSFIYANQQKYLVVPNYQPSTAVDHATLVVGTTQWEDGGILGSVPAFKFQNITGQISGPSASVSGQITNGDIVSFDTVEVVGIFKDMSGNVIGASETELDNFDPNTAQNFSVIYPAVPNLDPNATQVFAYALKP